MSQTNHFEMEHDEVEEEVEHILMGSGEYQLVGIRYYRGVAHPGEFVTLHREPNNPYDPSAIRVDNMHGEKVGHIKRQTAAQLAPLMDNQRQLRLVGSIPRPGNQWALPLRIDYYASGLVTNVMDVAKGLFITLQRALRSDYSFQFSEVFRTATASSSEVEVPSISSTTIVKKEIKNVDWAVQAKELDEMFDKQCGNQLKDLPDIAMPVQFKNITLFQHQIDGLKWLVHREKQIAMATNCSVNTNPFFKEVKEGSAKKWLCEITQCSQSKHPNPIMGSILADEMGLGKSIQTIGLILLSPPQGHTYPEGVNEKDNTKPNVDNKECVNSYELEKSMEENQVPIPSETQIKSQKAAILKSILKSAGFKQSGQKSAQIERILNGIKEGTIKGVHFPSFMTAPPPSLSSPTSIGTCTLIVCPASVMSNWQQQISNFVKQNVLTLDLYHGANRYNLLPQLQEGKIDVLLVTYQTLSAELGSANSTSSGNENEPVKKKMRKASIFDINFHRIVLDEGHTIRNMKTKYFKAVNQIKAARKLVLTGTPYVNKTDDICSLFSFLNVEPLGNQNIFWRAISQPIKDGHDIGLSRLRTAMSYVALRRSKTKVGIKLADKEVQLRLVEFSGDAHEKTYQALFGTFRVAIQAVLQTGESTVLQNYSSVFEKILRMRQSCCSAMLVPEKRRNIAIEMWDDLQSRKGGITLTKEEGLTLLEKLQGTFSQIGDENELPECAICLTEMEEQDSIILRKCGHVFCNLCIGNVLKMSSNKHCPLCRNPFSECDVIDKRHATKAASSSPQDNSNHTTSAGSTTTPPKILALLEAINEMNLDEKGVIFSQFTSFLDIVGNSLKVAGYNFVRVDGSMNPRTRIEAIKSFSSDDVCSPRFILCSLHAAGTGINLTRGNHAFMMDCWWNESVESQAMDRIHRIGQTRKVRVVRFLMKNSIEERMVNLQKAKSLQAKGAMEKLNAEEKRKARIDQLKRLLLLTDDDK